MPDNADAHRRALGSIARVLGDGALLWRGADADAADIDVVLLDRGEDRLAELDAAARWRDGRWQGTVEGRKVDVIHANTWLRQYPALEAVAGRAVRDEGGLRVASPEDRLLILASEAVEGRPVGKIARKATRLLSEPGARARLAEVARAERESALARLVAQPERLERRARRGRLSYVAALPAVASPRGRAALRRRLRARAQRVPPAARGASGGTPTYLIALSGMDGAGKSAAARAVAAHLEAAGLPSEVVWWRLAEETATLDRIATPVKRALRFRGSVADPVAAMSRTDDEAGGPAATARRGPGRVVGACWTLVIATLSARSFRAVAARRRAGVSLVCDRWTADALVDLEVRYGRRRAASWILSAAVPSP
ncbi:MAG: hypothetical protein QOE08_669, partial [Thermoleophilaceae bacterium]|nr:hypothetical protein [Thermoleophilaceae bacterium]